MNPEGKPDESRSPDTLEVSHVRSQQSPDAPLVRRSLEPGPPRRDSGNARPRWHRPRFIGRRGQSLRGPAGFLPFHAQFREAFPDIEVVVEDQLAEGDLVTTRCSVRGKHTGDSLGFAATQAPVEFTGIAITRIKDGKIVEAWNNFDFMKMYRQVGAI